MISVRHPIALLLCGIGLVSIGCSQTPIASETTQVQTPGTTPSQPLRQPDVVYVPTPQEVVDRMLSMAKVNRNDVLYDLGSGDGRIPITAAQKFGIRAVGIDINPERIKEANANAKKAGVSDRVRFLNQDLFQSKFGDATVVTLYLLPALNVKLRPQLLSQLKPGTRIVSHAFDMGEWKPEQTAQVRVNGQTHNVYMWTVPAKPPANLLSTVIADRMSRDRIAN
ncbi:SAM-dependent methyltransferase [Chamaesiphon polymorphus]|uniref:SAM-dependent methyltransferase n=1 Tax=Chamaesiphon polymorphus CCALA 037 TaxID=2107692 RepID=A0A2T1G8F0_9CYAN|nr:class I SAM-dependent methyltransferase [Chamaesiphon polymorphus]PSB53521.1 SAM-dependent methyltransferase [Chamaesiphon polymorphus CCALA 037]